MSDYQIDNREWWVQRWLELLDSYRFKKRLERARIYAREGNVSSIEFVGAQVLAKVQGSESEPYQVSLSLAPFTDEDWNYIVETMSRKAIFSARLLAGEMPDNIEEVFTANGLSLFPFTLSDIRSRCTCPDKANPCKHIGAVYYQLGDRFSEDPFVLFQLRGRTRTQILDALRQLRARSVRSSLPIESEIGDSAALVAAENSFDLAQFWHYEEPLETALLAIAPSPEQKTVLELLGKIPLETSDALLVKQFLERVYRTLSDRAIT